LGQREEKKAKRGEIKKREKNLWGRKRSQGKRERREKERRIKFSIFFIQSSGSIGVQIKLK